MSQLEAMEAQTSAVAVGVGQSCLQVPLTRSPDHVKLRGERGGIIWTPL